MSSCSTHRNTLGCSSNQLVWIYLIIPRCIKFAGLSAQHTNYPPLHNYPYNSYPIYCWPMLFCKIQRWIPMISPNHYPADPADPADSAWRPQRRIFIDGLAIHQMLHCDRNPHLGPSGRALHRPVRVRGTPPVLGGGLPGLDPGLSGSPGESKGRRLSWCPRPQRLPREIRHSIASQ